MFIMKLKPEFFDQVKSGKKIYEVRIYDEKSYILVKANSTDITNIIIPDKYNGFPVTEIEDSAFKDCILLKNVVIPNSILKIGSESFYCCESLESIIVPDSVIYIGEAAFDRCKSLNNIVLGKNLTILENVLFGICTSLKNIVIPNGIKTIEESVFFACQNLQSVTIPNTITSIKDGAFFYCISLKDVYFLGSKKEWEQIVIGPFNGNLTEANIHYIDNE